jgi:hypothetical protein
VPPLNANQYVPEWQNGEADRVALFALRNVTAGDTADLGQWFLNLKRAVVLATTVAGAAAGTVSGTVVTLPAGLSGDAGYLLAFGSAL